MKKFYMDSNFLFFEQLFVAKQKKVFGLGKKLTFSFVIDPVSLSFILCPGPGPNHPLRWWRTTTNLGIRPAA